MLRVSVLLVSVQLVSGLQSPLLVTRGVRSRGSAPVAVEPAAWSEWSLQNVGALDGSVLAVIAGGIYALSSGGDEAEALIEEAEVLTERVADAEREVRESAESSPCNGPSMEAIEALEAADAAVASTNDAVGYRRDPNELPGLSLPNLFRRSGRKSGS